MRGHVAVEQGQLRIEQAAPELLAGGGLGDGRGETRLLLIDGEGLSEVVLRRRAWGAVRDGFAAGFSLLCAGDPDRALMVHAYRLCGTAGRLPLLDLREARSAPPSPHQVREH